MLFQHDTRKVITVDDNDYGIQNILDTIQRNQLLAKLPFAQLHAGICTRERS